MISKRSKSIPNWESDCEVGKIWVSSQTTTKQTKFETHPFLGSGTIFRKLCSESAITDGTCHTLIENNEGNREKERLNQKATSNTEKK